MLSGNLDKLMSLLAAIRTRDAKKALELIDPQFIQHSPDIADGVEGLKQYIVDSSQNRLQMSVVRVIEDGPFVVAQLKSEDSGENMFAVFRFQAGLVAEQWVFSSPGAPPNKSGHTQLDGPSKALHLDDTEANKAFVRRYYEAFHLAGDRTQNSQFFTADTMIRHEPGVRDGLAEFLHDVEVLMQHRTIDAIELLVGQGDLVFIGAMGTHEGNACAYLDLYRVEKDKIVEHWGFPQLVPPQSEWRNSNGML